MTTRQNKVTSPRRDTGFSMIDVLVAIVVLATALLALAALQGALTRNAADARARSQIAAYSEGLLDQMRATSYDSIVTATISPSNAPSATTQEQEAYNAQTGSGVSNLQTVVTSTEYYGITAGTGGSFSTTAPSDLASFTPRYKQVNVATTWTDATGQARSIAFDTIVSPLTVENDNSLNSQGLSLLGSATPTVREYDPGATAGVIPIAVGSSQQTAATNPKPELLALSGNKTAVVGTSFNVLTFQNPVNSEAVIQQRIDTLVIACSCKYGGGVTSDNNTDFAGLLAQPYRPTYWDGAQYVSPTKASGSTSATGIDTTATQSDFCDICCRDHNDTATDAIKFDPWNKSGDYAHYRYNSSNVLTKVDSTDTTHAFLDACRLIRVEGQYAVATDLNDYFFGLLATTTPDPSSSAATTPVPDTTDTTDFGTGGAVGAYQKFVLAYLQGGLSSFESNTVPSVSTTAATYAGTPYNLDVPGNISISYSSTSTDYRYLHARGLYIDYLEPTAVTAIQNAVTNCTSSTVSDCYLPILPFTTINLTEIANWSVTTTSPNCTIPSNAVSVNNSAIIGEAFNSSRGVVTAQSCAHQSETATVKASMGNSNSGVAATGTGFANPVDQDDADPANSQNDTQAFTVSTSNSSGSGSVSATVTLTPSSVLPQLVKGYQSVYPSMSWQLDSVAAPTGTLTACTANATGNGNQTLLNNYSCPSITTASAPPLSATMTLKIQGYNYATSTKNQSNPCGGSGKVTITVCTNLQVDQSNILVNGSPVSPASVTVTNDGNVGNTSTSPATTAEMSTIVFPSLSLSTTDTVTVGFTSQGTTNAYTCSGTTYTATSCP